MPKAMEDRVPLASYWAAIKGKYNDLAKNPAYKPDINGPIKTYDMGINNYIKFVSERDKLMDLFPAYSKYGVDITNKIVQQRAELEKIMDKDQADVTSSINELDAEVAKKEEADPARMMTLLNDICTSAEEMVSSRKQIWDQLSKLGEAKVQVNKKLRDEYKAKAVAIINGMKKIEDDAVKLEAQIRSIISAYQKVATQLNKTEVVNGVREMLGHF